MTQDHYTENVMIGGTESQVDANGESVTELTEEEASALIKELRQSYPETPEASIFLLTRR